MKKIVLDTNIFLVSISEKSKVHWIFKALLNGKYTLCVTTDILAEYAEIIEREMGILASESTLGVLENLPNIELITTYYKFHLLKDEDDNKFVDCCEHILERLDTTKLLTFYSNLSTTMYSIVISENT